MAKCHDMVVKRGSDNGVSRDGSHWVFSSLASVETTLRKLVRQRGDELLIVRVASAKPKAIDLLLVKVDLTACKTMGPEGIQRETMTQEFDCTGLIRSAKVDDTTAWRAVQIKRPIRRE